MSILHPSIFIHVHLGILYKKTFKNVNNTIHNCQSSTSDRIGSFNLSISSLHGNIFTACWEFLKEVPLFIRKCPPSPNNRNWKIRIVFRAFFCMSRLRLFPSAPGWRTPRRPWTRQIRWPPNWRLRGCTTSWRSRKRRPWWCSRARSRPAPRWRGSGRTAVARTTRISPPSPSQRRPDVWSSKERRVLRGASLVYEESIERFSIPSGLSGKLGLIYTARLTNLSWKTCWR